MLFVFVKIHTHNCIVPYLISIHLYYDCVVVYFMLLNIATACSTNPLETPLSISYHILMALYGILFL